MGDLVKIISELEKAALLAAQKMKMGMEDPSTISVVKKADHTLQLSLDLISQESLVSSLSPLGIPLMLEEDPTTHPLVDTASEYIAVDPLDGTSTCKRFLAQPSGQVGFGPLLGYVKEGKLLASVFYNIPWNELFVAEKGKGATIRVVNDFSLQGSEEKKVLQAPAPDKLSQCGVLFFVGSNGELSLVYNLKRESAVENFYRFGGFANDCTRLARGYEQVQIQSMVKAWDFSATLFTVESGYEVICDPFGERVPFKEWKVRDSNPVLTAPPGFIAELFRYIDGIAP